MNHYHVYCRGIERQNIFIETADYERFLQTLWVFNSHKRTRFDLAVPEKREFLVDMLCFCIMPNHFHLLIKTENKKHLGKFMQKIMTAYTMYFKKKYKKEARVFESKYRFKYVENDHYLQYLHQYIHNNPLKLKYADYNSIDLLNGKFILDKQAIDWLNTYEYSSRNYTTISPPLTARSNLA